MRRRISVFPADPGYADPDLTKRLTVTLDGKELERCVTADEETGEAWCYVYPLVEASNGSFVTECLRGKVAIVHAAH